MDRIAVLHGEITAATRQFLAALAESDRHGDWAAEGFTSCAEWLAWRLGITRNAANEKVRAARALEELPLISRAMERGEVSFSKVRALTRAATPDNEGALLEFARAGSAAGLERLIRGWRRLDRLGEQKLEQLRHRSRCLSVFPDQDGMYVVRGRLDPEVGALLMRAIEAASDALYKRGTTGSASGPDTDPPDPTQHRADALGLLAERALAAGFGDPVSGSRAERYQVLVHVEPQTLAEHGEPGLSELADGTRVTAETARRVACDAGVVRVRRISARQQDSSRPRDAGVSGSGPNAHSPVSAVPELTAHPSILDVGRKTRTVPPSLRRALEARDRGCRFPGCGLRFTDAHHIRHWADGGETSLRNLVLLCRKHHRCVHEEGWTVVSDRDGQVVFFNPRGRAVAASPPPPKLAPDPMGVLIERNRQRGIEPDWRSGLPLWKRDRDVPWPIEAAAREALDPWDGDDGPTGEAAVGTESG